MKYILIILLLSFIILFVIYKKNINQLNKQINNLNDIIKNNINDYAKEYLENKDKNFQEKQSYYKNEEIKIKEEYNNKTKELSKISEEYENKIDELIKINDNLNRIKQNGIKNIDNELSLYRSKSQENIELKLQEQTQAKKEILKKKMKTLEQEAADAHQLMLSQYGEQEQTLRENISLLQDELEDFQKKREIVNRQILMQRELKEQEDFYKIKISDFDKEDLKLIMSLEQNFHNKEVLNRAIFDTFIKKPMNEMIKRVLQGKSPSGIYIITNLLTNEIYIGKAVSIDKRWQEHCKSCFSIGTIAHSTLHTRMFKEGLWNFSFQVLEEAPKEKLSEREKYWINFYQSKDYGMNERQGG